MKPLPAFVPVFIATLLAAAPAAAQGAWSVSLLPGISVGGAGDTQWSLLGATYRQVNPVAALGLEADSSAWVATGRTSAIGPSDPFSAIHDTERCVRAARSGSGPVAAGA